MVSDESIEPAGRPVIVKTSACCDESSGMADVHTIIIVSMIIQKSESLVAPADSLAAYNPFIVTNLADSDPLLMVVIRRGLQASAYLTSVL